MESAHTLTQEGHADLAEGVELEAVGRLQKGLGVGGVDDQGAGVDELQQQLQHLRTDAAHSQLQLLLASSLRFSRVTEQQQTHTHQHCSAPHGTHTSPAHTHTHTHTRTHVHT